MNETSVQCHWSPSASYLNVVSQYIELTSLMMKHVHPSKCIHPFSFPQYSWFEIHSVLIIAALMTYVRNKSLNMLIDQIPRYVIGLPRDAATKIAM